MKTKKKKVLIISTVGLKYEGITSVILANLEAMKRDDLDIYLAGTIEVHPEIAEKITGLGCEIIDLPNRRTDTAAYFKALIRVIRRKKIDVVHAHGNSATMTIEMAAAFLGGCRCRIAHSHNTCCEQVRADKMLRPFFYLLCNKNLACGKAAGEWLFGNRPFTIIANGRNIEKYKFDSEIRRSIREKYHWENKTVIGHVGGFLPQKNHTFLIDIFQAVHKKQPDTELVLFGDGPLRGETEQKVEKLGLKDCVKFMGLSDQVNCFLQAMDGMLLPSVFEGLPLVAVEWQIAALPCVLSNEVTTDCAFSDLVEFCSLEENPDVWADILLKKIKNTDRNEEALNVIAETKRSGFDIRDNAELLHDIYCGK